MHLDSIENIRNFSFDNGNKENNEDNSVLLEIVRISETNAVNETSKENAIWNHGSESGNYEYRGVLTGNVRNIETQTYIEYKVVMLPEKIKVEKVKINLKNFAVLLLKRIFFNTVITVCCYKNYSVLYF